MSRPWEAANARPFDAIIDNAVASLENLDLGFDDDSDGGSYYYYGAGDDGVGDDNNLLLFNLCESFASPDSTCTLVSETRQNSKKLVSLSTRGRINFAQRISL